MKTETKFGLLTIVILLGVFGYVVYEKWEERRAIIAAGGDPDAEEVAEEGTGEANPDDPFATANAAAPAESGSQITPAAATELSDPFPADQQGNSGTPAEFASNNNTDIFAADDATPFNEPEQTGPPVANEEPDFGGNDSNEFSNQFADDNPFGEPEPATPSSPANNSVPANNSPPQPNAFAAEDAFGSDLSEPAPGNGGTSPNFEPFNEPEAEPDFGDPEVAASNSGANGGLDDPFPMEQPEVDQFAEPAPEDLNAFNEDVPADFSEPDAFTEPAVEPEVATNDADVFTNESEEAFSEEAPLEETFAEPEGDAFTNNEEPTFNLNQSEPADDTFAGNGEVFEETSAPSEFSQNPPQPFAEEEAEVFADQNDLGETPFAEEETGDAFDLSEPNELDLAEHINASPFDEPENAEVATQPKPTANTGRPDPFAAKGEEYVVQSGDNLWRIANNIYGSGTYAEALAQHNRQTLPDATKLRPGMRLKTPTTNVLKQYMTASNSNVTLLDGSRNTNDPFAQKSGFFVNEETGEPFYKVQSNDTLTEIAYRHLGRASRWIQIVALNKTEIKDPKSLKPGTVLRLPADARTVVLTSDSFESDRK
ncbi:MAG: hypothetical protein CMJ46_08060 [Planctomyces sp.]|nr:hypothetical protein [Planctomyces sp.]